MYVGRGVEIRRDGSREKGWRKEKKRRGGWIDGETGTRGGMKEGG